MQFSTDLALMNTQPQRIKVDDATRTNDSRDISWYPDSCKGKLLKLVSLTNLFETLYPRLLTLLLLFFTTSFFEGMIIKSLVACHEPSRQKHIKFVMTLTRVPFQACFAIVGQNPVYLTLFI